MDMCHVALGIVEAYWEYRLKPWDMAAGVLVNFIQLLTFCMSKYYSNKVHVKKDNKTHFFVCLIQINRPNQNITEK